MNDYIEMPTEGHFIALWEYQGTLWAGNYQWIKGVLHSLEEGNTEWSESKFPYKGQENVHYLRSSLND